jgi:hypothetical protein
MTRFLFNWLTILMVAGPVATMAQQKVGIGTNIPQQRLSIDSTLNIDQGNYNNGTLPSLRLGSNSLEGLGSRRNPGTNQFGLDFYTAGFARLRIFNDGKVAIGTNTAQQMLSVHMNMNIDQLDNNTGNAPALSFGSNSGEGIGSKRTEGGNRFGLDFYTASQVRMAISQGGNLSLGNAGFNERLNVDGNIKSNVVYGTDFVVDRNAQNTGNFLGSDPSLMFGSLLSGEGIASKRTAGDRQYGMDFYTGTTRRMSILPSGNVEVLNNLTVNGGKGILRSADGVQQKKLTTNVLVNMGLAAYETKTIPVNFSESFSGLPDVMVSSVISGTGGWAEVVMTVINTNNNGCTLFVYNPSPSGRSVNFTVKLVAIGAQ